MLSDRAALAVWAMMAAYAAVFSWLSVLRYRGFSTGRFDLGNMVQAVWSTSEGRLLETTDITGRQFSRLGAHVDPVLVLFAPLWWVWSSPEMLLVAQALIVATGALPAFWLGRRWLGDDRLALAGAAAYLLYPAVQHATLFDFHPVTLAAPLLLFCIWAAEEARWVTLGVCAALAALCQEQVGLLIAALAVWLWFRHPGRRRAAAILGASALAWVATAVLVIMPAFALQSSNAHIGRYSRLGDSPREIALTFLTRPWEAVAIIATPGRLTYLLALLLPLLLLPLAAPMLALVGLPQLTINLFASTGPAQTVDYHYAILLAPVLVAASMLGLARIRAGERGEGLQALAGRTRWVAGALVGAVLAAGIVQGPLPLWGWIPGAWDGSPRNAFTMDPQARAMAEAVALVPDDAVVAATNNAGSHLSARRRILLLPRLGNADWALLGDGPRLRAMALDRPTLRLQPKPGDVYTIGLRARARQLLTSRKWALVYERNGVKLYRRVASIPGAPPPVAQAEPETPRSRS
ncbi:MAG: DUF2079 domain-containing protein [Blastococcus sp.]|nr:DUF2079 domain-containing protein [Blastococcus sp.]